MKDMELGKILKSIYQSIYYRLEISKKRRVTFFRFVLIHIGSTKVGRKFKRKNPQLLKIPQLIIFSGGFYIVKR